MTIAGYAPVRVEVFFNQAALDTEGYFVIGSSLIGGVDVIAGDVSVDITDYVYAVSTARGRSRELDTIQTGTCRVALRNYDGRFLPEEFNAAGPYVGDVFPGKRMRVSMAANDAAVFTGRIDEWHYSYDVSGEVDAWFEAVDGLGALASASFDDWTTTAGDTPGDRINAVLDRPEVDWGPARNIGTGVSTLQSDTIQAFSNPLNYCSLVAATDRAFFFASRDNQLTFIGRDELALRATLFADDPAYIFTDDLSALTADWTLAEWAVSEWGITEWSLGVATGGVPFSAIEIASSSELLFNRVAIEREGGATQVVNAVASQEAHGIRSLQVTGLLNETDDQSLSLAGALLDQYSQPQARVSAVTVILDSLDPASTIDVRVPMHDIGDMVKVKWTPVGSSTQVRQLSMIEGKYHQTTVGGLHTVTYALSPADQLAGFIIGDSRFGVIGVSKISF